MPKIVVDGAMLSCSKGTGPATLSIKPGRFAVNDKPVATVDDHVPMTNVPAFGMCTTQSNPQVAAATSAAQGVLTPQPCTPVLPSKWSPGSSMLGNDDVEVVREDSACDCAWSGKISITSAGQDRVEVDK